VAEADTNNFEHILSAFLEQASQSKNFIWLQTDLVKKDNFWTEKFRSKGKMPVVPNPSCQSQANQAMTALDGALPWA
jgi:hypothetical protein